MEILLLVFIGVLGLLIGSFLNVVIYRVPLRKSIVRPPSACPTCGERIRARDNIPVLSWLVLRGKCRNCAAPISVRYPIVELLTGLLFVAVALRFPLDLSAPTGLFVAMILVLLGYLYFAAISVALTGIDLDTSRLPNVIVLPAYAVLAALLVASALLAADFSLLVPAAIGGAVLFLFYLALALLKPGGMGFGDVKLAGVIGIVLGALGWGTLIVGAFSAFLLGGMFGVALVIARRAGRKSRIPFGPWMLAGAWIGILVGERIWRAYLGLFQLA